MQVVKGKCLVWRCREVHRHRIEGIASAAGRNVTTCRVVLFLLLFTHWMLNDITSDLS